MTVPLAREGARREREGDDEGDEGSGRQVTAPLHQERDRDAEKEAGAADGQRQRVGLLQVALKVVGRGEAGCPRGDTRLRLRRRCLPHRQRNRKHVG